MGAEKKRKQTRGPRAVHFGNGTEVHQQVIKRYVAAEVAPQPQRIPQPFVQTRVNAEVVSGYQSHGRTARC